MAVTSLNLFRIVRREFKGVGLGVVIGTIGLLALNPVFIYAGGAIVFLFILRNMV